MRYRAAARSMSYILSHNLYPNHAMQCRAAAKLISALVHAYPDQLSVIYSKAASELVSRFREREENVKADVFTAYCDLLRQVGLKRIEFESYQEVSWPVLWLAVYF